MVRVGAGTGNRAMLDFSFPLVAECFRLAFAQKRILCPLHDSGMRATQQGLVYGLFFSLSLYIYLSLSLFLSPPFYWSEFSSLFFYRSQLLSLYLLGEGASHLVIPLGKMIWGVKLQQGLRVGYLAVHVFRSGGALLSNPDGGMVVGARLKPRSAREGGENSRPPSGGETGTVSTNMPESTIYPPAYPVVLL